MDEAAVGYVWETEYERTWEALREDEAGSLQASIDDVIQKAKRKRLLERPVNVRLGMMRHLFIIIDMSAAMLDQDLKPNRLFSTLKLLENFIEEFFDQNPISQLGILTMKKKRCERITDLGGNCKRHMTELKKLRDVACEGEASLHNALDQAMQSLKNVPGHVSREILIIFGSLSTVDPCNVFETAKSLKASNIRCSVIGLSASLNVCQKICRETQGKYGVILDESHFKSLLSEHLMPPAACVNQESSLVRMGFPQHETQAVAVNKPSMCMCHLDSPELNKCFGKSGYFCPQCHSKYCELPIECVVCGLPLVSAPHLARSYHHLFPLESFEEFPTSTVFKQNRFCQGCQKYLSEANGYKCRLCEWIFCIDCDLFIHETLHSCPGCASKRKV